MHASYAKGILFPEFIIECPVLKRGRFRSHSRLWGVTYLNQSHTVRDMYPPVHFLFPFMLTFLLHQNGLIPLYPAFLAGFVGLFVDVDHYIEHMLYAKKDRFSLRRTWNNATYYHRFNERSFIHHWQGLLLLSLLFAAMAFFSWQTALAMAIGYYSHMLLDHVHMKKTSGFSFKGLYLRASKAEHGLVIASMLVILMHVLF